MFMIIMVIFLFVTTLCDRLGTIQRPGSELRPLYVPPTIAYEKYLPDAYVSDAYEGISSQDTEWVKYS